LRTDVSEQAQVRLSMSKRTGNRRRYLEFMLPPPKAG